MSYAFVDRKCHECDGYGCELCQWTGMIGELQEAYDIEQPKPTEFGSKLRYIRQNSKITLRELAPKFGCSVSHLSNIETGMKYPKDNEAKIIEEWINGE